MGDLTPYGLGLEGRIFFLIVLFIYLFLAVLDLLLHFFSLVAASRGKGQGAEVAVQGSSHCSALSCWGACAGFSSSGTWAQ